AGPAAGALEAARRSRLVFSAPSPPGGVGAFPPPKSPRPRAPPGAAPPLKKTAGGRRPRAPPRLGGRAGPAAPRPVAARAAVLDPAQRLPPARERGERTRAALVRDLGAERHERDRQHRFRLQLSLYVQRALCRGGGLFQAPR